MVPLLGSMAQLLRRRLLEKKHLMIRFLGRGAANHKVLYVQKNKFYDFLFLDVKHLMICCPPTQKTNHKVLFFEQPATQKLRHATQKWDHKVPSAWPLEAASMPQGYPENSAL